MIKGHINIDFVTNDMLHDVHFGEPTLVQHANGLWEDLGVSEPLYPSGAAIVYQLFGDACPTWAHQIKSLFDEKILYSTVTINLLKPGNFIPPHKDMFYRLMQFAKDNKIDMQNKEPIRINVFLQDRKLGHFFEMENNFCSNYKKGDFTIIKQGKVHSVINIGNENRYTLQVSGFADKDISI
jgi:hypothetical protein